IDVLDVPLYGLFLVNNPVGVNWGPRTPLTLSWSGDDGTSWMPLLDLETGVGEFSYPAIVGDAERLLVSYTGDRRSIEVRELRVTGRTAD
ncbi:MAG TPA: exo-alpha-sialidase, partial [Propionibacteriaceae bacterium]|nr:exo-alpha-sialidase [Propionibacteriaceae bacterium]